MAGLLDQFMSARETCIPVFHNLSRPVADAFGPKNLGPHFDVLVYSFILFNLANIVFVPGVSWMLFARTYRALNARVRSKWCATFPRIPRPLVEQSKKLISIQHPSSRNCRGVSLIHVFVVIPLTIRCLRSPALSADRAFGWDERAGTAFAVTAGYFLWDAIDTIVYFEAFGFVAHGSCRPRDI